MNASVPRADIKITALQTGTANLHARHERGVPGSGSLQRKLAIMRDREWVGPLPIYAYLIEHPEGLFVVDTGDTARNSERDWLPRTNPFFQKQVQIRVAPEEEIGARLRTLGIDPARDIRALLMTHLHHDHTGGLNHFPHTRIYADPTCLAAARRQRGLIGAVPGRWPRWFDPEPFHYGGGALGPWRRCAPVTGDGSLLVVETPGHMVGHVCVIARGLEMTYILAGDLTYRQRNLLADDIDGVTYDPAVSLTSQQAVKAFAHAEPTILLPAHDPDAAERLAAGSTLFG